MSNITEITGMDLVDKLFGQSGGADASQPLVSHQIDSYNEFLDKKLTQIIQGFNPIQVYQRFLPDTKSFAQRISVSVLNPAMGKPAFQKQDGTQLLMTPHLARMNNLTYASTLHVDVHVTCDEVNEDGVTERTENTIPNVCLGRIPIMVKSKACVLQQMPGITHHGECRFDPGGYFIVNGNEKVVISQDRISGNTTHVFCGNANDGITAEIRSTPDGIFLPPKTTTLQLAAKPNHMGRLIKLNTSFLRAEIPLFVMFRALGVVSDLDIMRHIVLDERVNDKMVAELAACAEDASDIHTQDAALTHMLRLLGVTGTPREYLEDIDQAKAVLLNVLKNDFLPHSGPLFGKKAFYLGYMTRKLLRIYMGLQPADNRDSCMNKRIDAPGFLFGNLFRQCYGKMIKEMRKMVQREIHLWRANARPTTVITSSNVHRFFKQTTMESGLRYALSTGNWGVKTLGSFNNMRQGVAQMLNRMSYLSMISYLRRINTPMEKNGKLTLPRKLDITQFGMICPAETPEGGSVGLVKNMAMSTVITTSMSTAHLRICIKELRTRLYEDFPDVSAYLRAAASAQLVFVNGDLVGYHDDPVTFYRELKHLKRCGQIPPMTSIVWDIKLGTISMNTEAGRLCRPMRIVDQYRCREVSSEELAARTFKELVAPLTLGAEGIIEYLDVDELDKAMIAMTPSDLAKPQKGDNLPPRYTHCEIHPSLMNGVLAANIPFSDHNQAPRNCYQCLWEETPVLMADGRRLSIKDVRVGDRVVTFNPTTLALGTSQVVHQFVKPTDKRICRLETTGGRTIVATEDHKFMTEVGWMELKDIRPYGARLAICDHGGLTFFEAAIRIDGYNNVRIADITVESEDHSFIAADGFMVHNSSMGKQAVGIYASNYNERMDTMAHVLNYSQKALARSHLSKITQSETLTGGINAVVAIMTYTGFNQEDSVMINQSAIDRGLFTSTHYKTYRDMCNKNHSTGEEEVFCVPEPGVTAAIKPLNYDKLGPDGFVFPNTYVDGGDILVGKVMPHVVQGHNMPRDASLHMKSNEHGVVDQNFQGINSDGYKFCKVKLREHRIPVIGDKFSSKHAQKGSLGMTYRQHDMPFSKDGIIPDIIVNPHAIPSRMTIGQLMECLMGKAACAIGAMGDATPYNGCTVEDIASVLDAHGMERYGNEILYDGRTGQQIHTEIFIGPTYYQRLKHNVEDKIHSRSGGPVVLLTRQPAEGRARNGGLRFGEMEVQACISHGIASFLKERSLEQSDHYRVFICANCGMLATANPERNIFKCTTCKNTADFRQIRCPYALKLLFQELETMNIAPRMIV